MKSVIQRVTRASVRVDNQVVGQIDDGVMILLSVAPTDDHQTVKQYVDRLLKLAIFVDGDKKMSHTIEEVGATVLLVSQITLHASLKKGKRPSFTKAAQPEHAKKIYKDVVAELRRRNITVETGQFATYMQVDLINDGPVTLLLDVDE